MNELDNGNLLIKDLSLPEKLSNNINKININDNNDNNDINFGNKTLNNKQKKKIINDD